MDRIDPNEERNNLVKNLKILQDYVQKYYDGTALSTGKIESMVKKVEKLHAERKILFVNNEKTESIFSIMTQIYEKNYQNELQLLEREAELQTELERVQNTKKLFEEGFSLDINNVLFEMAQNIYKEIDYSSEETMETAITDTASSINVLIGKLLKKVQEKDADYDLKQIYIPIVALCDQILIEGQNHAAAKKNK